uniref:Uncharacterized protein n=1 Tax=Panagrolaimus davidi TaxID=227884 RepID=A0A914QTY0_9BILA
MNIESALEVTTDVLEEKVAAYEAKVADLTGEVNKLTADNSDLKIQKESIEKAMNEKVTSLQLEVDELRKKVNDLEKEKDSLKKDLEDKNQSVNHEPTKKDSVFLKTQKRNIDISEEEEGSSKRKREKFNDEELYTLIFTNFHNFYNKEKESLLSKKYFGVLWKKNKNVLNEVFQYQSDFSKRYSRTLQTREKLMDGFEQFCTENEKDFDRSMIQWENTKLYI